MAFAAEKLLLSGVRERGVAVSVYRHITESRRHAEHRVKIVAAGRDVVSLRDGIVVKQTSDTRPKRWERRLALCGTANPAQPLER